MLGYLDSAQILNNYCYKLYLTSSARPHSAATGDQASGSAMTSIQNTEYNSNRERKFALNGSQQNCPGVNRRIRSGGKVHCLFTIWGFENKVESIVSDTHKKVKWQRNLKQQRRVRRDIKNRFDEQLILF